MSQGRSGYHQDYIARIRFSNALPPPPFAPKLLEIRGSGLGSEQYTSAGFASRLAREQPLNIEADAELGMKIDLVGLKGVFDGDESVILFPDNPPPIDPKDRALLKPLSALGKNTSAAANSVSFLRRTEYITSHTGSRNDGSGALRAMNSRQQGRRPQQQRREDGDKNEPLSVLRAVEKGFNLAYPQDAYLGSGSSDGRIRGADPSAAEKEAWGKPRHPTNPKLKLLDTYPVLPDFDALPDSGSYIMFKYQTNPAKASNVYDERLDHMILLPLAPTPEQQATFEAQLEAHTANPSKVSRPTMPAVDYVAFIPEGGDGAEENLGRLKRKYDVFDPEHDSDDLYPHPASDRAAKPHFIYERLRAYETYQQTSDVDALWNESVAIALHEPRDDEHDVQQFGRATKRQKAAYMYPILQKSLVRARRNVTTGVGINRQQRPLTEEEKVDQFVVTVADPDDSTLAEVQQGRDELDPVEGA